MAEPGRRAGIKVVRNDNLRSGRTLGLHAPYQVARRRGEGAVIDPRFRTRRRAVERSRSRLNRFRRLLIRWEKKAANYEAMLEFACAITTLQHAGVSAWALSLTESGDSRLYRPGLFSAAGSPSAAMLIR